MICLGALRLLGRGRRQQTPIKLVGNSHSHSNFTFHIALRRFRLSQLIIFNFFHFWPAADRYHMIWPRVRGVATGQQHSLWAAGIVALMSCPLPWKRLRQR